MKYNSKKKSFAASDFDMATIRNDRVCLPYRGELWPELMLCAYEVALDHWTEDITEFVRYEDMIDSASEQVCVLFNLYREIMPLASITVHMTNGKRFTASVPMRMEPSDICSVLDRFFADGSGLAPSFQRYLQHRYKIWRHKNI